MNWWEAYAFCIWDGGFLPSEAEWEYAAAGGSQQREYPWGSTAPGTGTQYAIDYPTGYANGVAPVGTATLGAGLWGQLDMAGELWKWNIDWFAAYAACTDCADFTAASTPPWGLARVTRGGGFTDFASGLLPPDRQPPQTPADRDVDIGFRCARTP